MNSPNRSTGASFGHVVWVAVRVAFGVVALTVLLVLFAGVFAGSVYVAGKIVSSGSAGEDKVLAERRAKREADALFNQMVLSEDQLALAGETTAATSEGVVVQRAYEVPVLKRFEIESRFGGVSGVEVTWYETTGKTFGFGENAMEVRDGYNGLVLTTTITE